MFDPWQLRTLSELQRRGTMAAVAEAISLTPSAVSQQLVSLERQAGVELLEPDGRRVRLTAAGRTLAARRRGDHGAGWRRRRRATPGELPIGGGRALPTVIGAFAERHPRHRIRLAETETAASIAAVVSGEVDHPQETRDLVDLRTWPASAG